MIPESLLIQGLISGVTYALLACGFTLVYGVSGIINLAHGTFYMLGAYFLYILGPLGFLQLGPPQAIILAPLSVGFLAVVLYIICVRPIVEDFFAVMVITVAIANIFQQLMLILFGPRPLPIPSLIRGAMTIGRAGVTYSRILSFAISIILFAGLWIFTTKTKIGTAMRATAQDREVAMFMGINVRRLYVLAILISAILAALSGILVVSSVTRMVRYDIWLTPLTLSFSIVVLGGLGNIKGSFIGGLVLGYAETAVISIGPEGSYLKDIIPLAIMVIVLLFRPRGLFGRRVEAA